MISCNCETGCERGCGCRKGGIQCSAFCGQCRGGGCSNSETPETDEEKEDALISEEQESRELVRPDSSSGDEEQEPRERVRPDSSSGDEEQETREPVRPDSRSGDEEQEPRELVRPDSSSGD